MRKIILPFLLGGILLAGSALAISTYQVIQGGTGSTTLSGILIGNGTSPVQTLTVGSNLNLTGTTLSGTGGGSGTVGTSSPETAGQIPYWTTTNGFPARLGSVATGTITCTGSASCGAGSYVIGNNLTITATAGGGGSAGWNFIPGAIYNSTTTDQVLIGGTATTSTAKLEVNGGIFANASSTINSLFHVNGILSASSSILSDNLIQFQGITTPSAPPSGYGQLYGATTQGITRPTWQNGCPAFTIGRDNIFVVRNTSASSMSAGQIVSVTGATGNVPNVSLALADKSMGGMAADFVIEGGIGGTTIASTAYGCAMKLGILTGINTSAFASGDMVYLSTTTPGAVVNFQPVYPDESQMIGQVLVSGIGNGSISYHITSGAHNADTGTYKNSWSIGSLGDSTNKSLIFSSGFGTSTLTVNALTNQWGIGSSSPAKTFSVQGNGLFSGDLSVAGLTATGTINTALTASKVVSTDANGALTVYGGTSCTNQFIRSLNGAGSATCASVSLTNDITGTLGVGNGGTGQVSFSSGQLLYGSGTNGIQSVGTSTLTATSPLTGSFTQVGSGGSLGCQTASGAQAGCLSSTDWNTFNGKLSLYDAWTHPAAGQSATTSTIILSNGFVSAASSTLSNLGTGGLAVNNGLIYNAATTTFNSPLTYSAGAVSCSTCVLTTRALTVAGTANQITSSAGSQDLSADRTWTLSLPNHVIFPTDFVASAASTTNATSTNLTVTNNLITSTLSKLLLTDANGSVSGYTGASCTNQFIRSLSVLGAPTCATVANTDLANSTISGISLGSNLNSHSHDTTLNGTSYNGSAAVSDWGLNLASFNTWTASSTFPNINLGWVIATSSVSSKFGNASTTQLTLLGKTYDSNNSAGTNGYVLSISNGLPVWVATSTSGGGITSLNGLTGATQTFTTNNGLLSINSAGTAHNFDGSTTPTFGWLNATSSATSTFAGGVATNLLNVTSSTATSTFANGIQLTRGCFKDVSGNCISAGGSTPTATLTSSIPIDCNMPQTGSEDFAPGGAWWTGLSSGGGAWEMQNATSSSIYCIVHIPNNLAATPNAKVLTTASATTTGNAILNIEAVDVNPSGGNYVPLNDGSAWKVILNASTTAASRLAITGGANYPGTATSTAFTTPAISAGHDLLLRYRRYGADANDTVKNDIFLMREDLQIDINVN